MHQSTVDDIDECEEDTSLWNTNAVTCRNPHNEVYSPAMELYKAWQIKYQAGNVWRDWRKYSIQTYIKYLWASLNNLNLLPKSFIFLTSPPCMSNRLWSTNVFMKEQNNLFCSYSLQYDFNEISTTASGRVGESSPQWLERSTFLGRFRPHPQFLTLALSNLENSPTINTSESSFNM